MKFVSVAIITYFNTITTSKLNDRFITLVVFTFSNVFLRLCEYFSSSLLILVWLYIVQYSLSLAINYSTQPHCVLITVLATSQCVTVQMLRVFPSRLWMFRASLELTGMAVVTQVCAMVAPKDHFNQLMFTTTMVTLENIWLQHQKEPMVMDPDECTSGMEVVVALKYGGITYVMWAIHSHRVWWSLHVQCSGVRDVQQWGAGNVLLDYCGWSPPHLGHAPRKFGLLHLSSQVSYCSF